VPEEVAEPGNALQSSLEDQLMAELSFEDSFASQEQPAIALEPQAEPEQHAMAVRHEEFARPEEVVREEEIAALPHELEYSGEAAEDAPQAPDDFDEFAAILEEGHPKASAHVEVDDFDHSFEAALGAPEEAVAAEAAALPEQQLDSLDFGSAFEAELREMEFAAETVPAAPAAPVRRAHISLATPVAPKREVPSERALEDHFAAAFAEELDLGVSKALEQGRKPAAPVRPAPAAPARTAAASAAPAPVTQFQDVPESWEQEYPLDPMDEPADELAGQRIVPPPAGMSRGMKLGAAALAIAVVVGGGALAMSLMGGDGPVASSEPVVVKADAGPVKVKPENPGGIEIQNQNQDVYNKVAGASAEGSQEKLVSASEEPVEIARVAEEQPATAVGGAENAADAQPVDAAKADVRLTPSAEEVSSAPAALAPRRVKTLLIKPDGTVVPAPAEETVASVEQASGTVAALAAEGASAAGQAVEAAVEPVANAAEAAGEAVAGAAQVAAVDPAAAAAPGGEWAVQLASQRSAEDAQATFQNLKQKFPSVLDGKPLAVQRAEVEGKGVFYRVRVPTQTKEEAVSLCEQLKAAGGSCFIAR
nr:SPOR domain-containing protein [Nitratireductor sp.]